MKKYMILLIAFVTVFLTACSVMKDSKEEKNNTIEQNMLEDKNNTTEQKNEETEKSPEELLNYYLENPDILETPVREYGEGTGYIQLEGELVVRILYPEGELTILTDIIEDWVNDTVSYYQKEAVGSSEYDTSAELTAEYESYIVDEKWVSVKIAGRFDRPYIAHPVDVISTFHANLETGELITLDDLLLPNGRNLLQDKVIADANIDEKNIDEYMLDLWTLTSDGLEIVLERGDYTPMSEGTVVLFYPYEELEGILINFAGISQGESDSENNEGETSEQEENGESTQEVNPAEQVTSDKPMVALTFDDGPSKHTQRLLDIFAEYGGKGTFFVVGNLLENYPEILQRMASEHHEIGGHSWNHRQLTKLSSEEMTDQIMSTRAKIYEITGIDTTILRPPYGSNNDELKNVCAELGVIMANWSIDTLDWDHKDANQIYEIIMEEVEDGEIILCHDLYGSTVDAMERVIPELISRGYQLVTVSELLSHSEKPVTAGNVYYKK